MITNTKVFGNHLDKDVDRIFFDEYSVAPSEYEKIAKVKDAPAGDHYTEAEISPLSDLREVPEGDGIQFDMPVEGNKKVIYYDAYGLGFQITPQMYKDDLTGNFKQMPSKLAKSAAQKPNVVFFNQFNSGFNGGTQTSWDGLPIFATNHVTLKSGQTIANAPATAGSLSETTLQAAFEYFDNLIDEAGNPLLFSGGFTLLVPNQLKYSAMKLMKNVGAIGTANNDMNVANASEGLFGGYNLHVSRYLTSASAWFLVSNEHTHTFCWKDRPELSSADDFYTGNALFKVWERFAAFTMDYKPSYGNPGA